MFETLSEKDEAANNAIFRTAVTLAVVGAANPIPLVGDVGIVLAGWGRMLFYMANLYEAHYDKNWLLKALAEVFKSLGWYAVSTTIFIGAIELAKFTGVGTISSMIMSALFNACFTFAVGNMYKEAWRIGEEPTEAQLSSAIRSSIEYVQSRNVRQKAREVYSNARKEGLSREDSLKEVVKEIPPGIGHTTVGHR
ncbi:MAG: DUF697 domain-containing protein [Chloroflexota bacterium]